MADRPVLVGDARETMAAGKPRQEQNRNIWKHCWRLIFLPGSRAAISSPPCFPFAFHRNRSALSWHPHRTGLLCRVRHDGPGGQYECMSTKSDTASPGPEII